MSSDLMYANSKDFRYSMDSLQIFSTSIDTVAHRDSLLSVVSLYSHVLVSLFVGGTLSQFGNNNKAEA